MTTVEGAQPAPAGSAAKALRMPITNIHDGSAYSAQLSIGSRGVVANLMLDTGSGTLAVESAAYDGTGDTALNTTTLAQLITYAGGGWAGPVVTTDLGFGAAGSSVVLKAAPIAIAVVQQGSLGTVNGVLGLAYAGLNSAFDFANYLAGKGAPATTHPWPFGTGNWDRFSTSFTKLVQAHAVPRHDVTPCLDLLQSQGGAPNKFAFHTQRSSVSLRGADPASIASDPLNNGVFVLGGGEEQEDLYEGEFVTAAVLHDLFYNVGLVSVRVGELPAVAAAGLQAQFQQTFASNAIVDSGSEWLALADDVYQAVLSGLKQLNPAFALAVRDAQANQSVVTDTLSLSDWPNICFTLSGVDGEGVALTVTPQTYWQADFPAAGRAAFKISGPLSEANQSNLGLPLINNYYTIFDRSQGAQGVVRFAPIRPPAAVSLDSTSRS
jgi:hypothetical protein